MAKDPPVNREGKGHIDARVVVGGILLALLLVFIFQNTNETQLNVLFWDVNWPLWLTLAITVVISLGVGFMLGRRSRAD